MVRKALSLLVILFCLNLLLSTLSCRRDKYRQQDTYCVRISETSLVSYNDPVHAPLTPLDTAFPATSLRIQLNVLSTVESCLASSGKADGLSLFNTVYAYSAPSYENYMRPDSIVGYRIYSNTSYDDAHPAGASLNDIFSTDDVYLLKSPGGQPVRFNFYCEQPPASSGTYVFLIELTLKDGGYAYARTVELKLIK
jgi:hypothetical protein